MARRKNSKNMLPFYVISIVINDCEVCCTSCVKDNVKSENHFKGVAICKLINSTK